MELTKVTDILQTVGYSVDFGSINAYDGDTEDERRTNFWKEVIADKASDCGFGHLVDSILTNGWSSQSAVGWCYYGDQWEITEGHHRLVAAILLGMDRVQTDDFGSCDGLGISAHAGHHDPHPIDL
jgi:hypothetical protein